MSLREKDECAPGLTKHWQMLRGKIICLLKIVMPMLANNSFFLSLLVAILFSHWLVLFSRWNFSSTRRICGIVFSSFGCFCFFFTFFHGASLVTSNEMKEGGKGKENRKLTGSSVSRKEDESIIQLTSRVIHPSLLNHLRVAILILSITKNSVNQKIPVWAIHRLSRCLKRRLIGMHSSATFRTSGQFEDRRYTFYTTVNGYSSSWSSERMMQGKKRWYSVLDFAMSK